MALTSGDILAYDGSQWNNQPSTSNTINLDSGTFYLDGANDRIGIGTTGPAAKLHVIHTAQQLRLGYDATNYVTFTVDSGASLTIGNNQSVGTADIFINPENSLELGTARTDGILLGRSDTVIRTTVQGRLHVEGSFETKTATKTGNYTLTNVDSVIFVDADAAARTITLPDADANTVGRVYDIFKIDDDTSHLVTLAVQSGDSLNGTVDGTLTINTQWQCLRVVGHTSSAWIASRLAVG